jgi:hypothetical protein
MTEPATGPVHDAILAMGSCKMSSSHRRPGKEPVDGTLSAGPSIMEAKSKKQQMAAGAALSAKRGDTKPSDLKGASKSMAESMSEEQLEDLASTPRKDLPEKKEST